ncbi:MAG: hypothetical protein JWM87_701 [Candidatus Eremiobacteraeota bacterium]|nr:hypothetical protein [Candidatus Eremiobacteraeota bacterium]
MGDTSTEPGTGPARLFRIVVAEVVGDADQHVNTAGMLAPQERTARVLCAFLRRYGTQADPKADGAEIVVQAADEQAAAFLRFALVCALAATSYRNEAEVWVCAANGDRRPPEEVATENAERRKHPTIPPPPWCG